MVGAEGSSFASPVAAHRAPAPELGWRTGPVRNAFFVEEHRDGEITSLIGALVAVAAVPKGHRMAAMVRMLAVAHQMGMC